MAWMARGSTALLTNASRLQRALRVVAAGILAVTLLWAFPADAQTLAGKVTSLVGAANVQRAGATIAVTIDMAVMVGDGITVNEGGKVTITLSDGSLLQLGSSANIVIDQQLLEADGARGSTRIRLLSGLLRSVARLSSRGMLPNFEVHTPNAITAVRGTDFEVDFIEGKPCPVEPSCLRYTTVGVYKGIVEVTNPTSPSGSPGVQVRAGDQTNVPCEIPPTSPGPWGIEELGAPGYH